MRLVIALVLLLSSSARGGLTYNGDMECGYPFSEFTIEEMECTANTYYTFGDYDYNEAKEYAYYQQQNEQEQYDGEDEEEAQAQEDAYKEQFYEQYQEPGSCLPGEVMDVSGSVTIFNEPVSKYFDVTLKMCWTKWNFDFKCVSHTEKVDLGYLSQQAQQQDEQEEEQQEEGQEGEDGQVKYWYNPNQYSSDNEDYYLQPGTYEYSIRVTIPDNKWTEMDTPAHLYMTFKPAQNYKHTYFQERQWFSRVKDYRTKTKCYATFNDPYGQEDGEEGEQQYEGQYYNGNYNYQYQQAAFGAGLLSLLVAYRRRQLALREQAGVPDHYEKHDEA